MIEVTIVENGAEVARIRLEPQPDDRRSLRDWSIQVAGAGVDGLRLVQKPLWNISATASVMEVLAKAMSVFTQEELETFAQGTDPASSPDMARGQHRALPEVPRWLRRLRDY